MTWNKHEIPTADNKTAVITGANRGLGFEVTKELVNHNCSVIMACRNLEKAEKAKSKIVNGSPGADIELIQLNLADLNSIREFNDQFAENYSNVDFLVNNAGIFHAPQMESEDGYEMHLAVNHLGHFLLTNHLFKYLKQAEQSRIVTVTSIGYRFGELHFDDINLREDYTRTKGYAQSKLANLMFAIELQRRIDANQITNVKSIATHPGVSKTNIYKTGPHLHAYSLWNWFYYPFYFLFSQSPEKGALSILRAIFDDNLVGGEFIGPKGMFGIRGRPEILQPQSKAIDTENAKKLWDLSEELTKIKFTI